MSHLRSKPLTERLICACENHPWLINISATMRLGVSHVHRPGNELTLLSVYHSAAAAAANTQEHRGSRLISHGSGQSISQSRSPDVHYLHVFLSFISWSNDRNMFPGFSAWFFFFQTDVQKSCQISRYWIIHVKLHLISCHVCFCSPPHAGRT